MENNKYQVVLFKTEPPSEDTINKLSALFKISSDKATQMLSRDEFVIKKEIDKQTAEKFHKAITATGASCRIDEEAIEFETPLPGIEDIASPTDIKPLTDPTRPEIQPQNIDNKPLDLSLEAQTKQALPEDVSPEKFCPECGSIREAVESICLHCGYDPDYIAQSSNKAIIKKILMGATLLIIIAVIAWPFIQTFIKQQQVKDDLALAFDTRNMVTDFIQKTNFWPNQNIDAGLEKDINNRSIKSVQVVDNAEIQVTLRAEALEGEEQTLIFTPNTLKGRIVWNCLKGDLAADYRPEVCLPKPVNE